MGNPNSIAMESLIAHSTGAILAVDCTVAPPITALALDHGTNIEQVLDPI